MSSASGKWGGALGALVSGGQVKKVLPKESAAGQVSRAMSSDSQQSASGERASYQSRSRFRKRGESGLLGAGYELEEMK